MWVDESVYGKHGVQYKFIDKDLKGAIKLHGKFCYLTRPIKEDSCVASEVIWCS